MDRPGEKLKRVREKLKLTYRDVEKASQQIAARRERDEFAIALSRLADIENKGTVPTIFRLYSLCAIYRLDAQEVLRWYGVPLEMLASESLNISLNETHITHFSGDGPATVPTPAELSLDLNSTTFLSHVVRRWGKTAIRLLNGVDLRQHRFGFVGLEDWSMHPVLHPGSLVLIDEGKRRIASTGWATELERPIYFLEHRTRYLCGWCSETGDQVMVQPHPSSQQNPVLFDAGEIDVIGQVVGVAMLLESKTHRHAHTSGVPAGSPNR
jgi:transcriptional regulator with XRE-family HTH domain